MPLRLAVIGDPVAHSRSPELHRGFLAESGIEGTYEALQVGAGTGLRSIRDLRARGYRGLNVTTPLKEEAYAAAETRDAAALASGAVNTLVFANRIAGYNTDGIGALGALAAAGLPEVAGRRILVVGAGATARAAIVALVAAGAGVSVWNRTAARASALRTLGARAWDASVQVDGAFAAVPPDAQFDDALVAALHAAPVVIDANYGTRATLRTRLGRDDVRDGTDMLRASARASFEVFVAAATP